MSKAEEIVSGCKVYPDYISADEVLQCVNEAMEWCAQQCEGVASGDVLDSLEEDCAEHVCAKAIRAGKSA